MLMIPKSRGSLHQLIDNFSLFHMQFAAANRYDADNYWTACVPEGTKYAWRGLAFERLCLAHVRQIKAKLGISDGKRSVQLAASGRPSI